MSTSKLLESNIQSLIITAAQKYQSEELIEAELIYRKLLQIKPDQRESFNSISNQCHLIANLNLGTIFKKWGKLDEAVRFYQQALKLSPDAAVYNNLGNVFQEQGKLAEAIDAYQQALKLSPDAAVYNNLGNVFQEQGKLAEAIDAYQQALKLSPDAAVYNNLGTVFQEQGKLTEAVNAYQQALKLGPDDAVYNNLGNVFQEQGKLAEAINAYQQALKLSPDAVVYNNLGNLLEKQGQLEEAIQLYSQALKLKADPKICNNLASTLSRQGEREQALEYYQQALSLAPNYAPAQLGLLTSQLPIIYTSTAEIQQRRANYQHVLQQLAQHYQQATPAERAKAAEAVGTSQPFYLAYQGLLDRPLQQIYGELICQLMSSRYPQWSHPLALPTWQAPEKIRVGVVCGLFFKHSVWKIPLKGWVQNLDRERFDLLGYYTGSRQDEETAVAAQAFGQFRQGPLPVEQWCELIAQDRLHVLLFPEFGMDPMSAKLGGLRLAPIQATCGGHPQTCGLPTIDYHLSSDLMEPANAQDHYSETLVRLPNLAICYTFLDVQPQAVSRADLGIAADEVMFWCCQSLYKYLPQHDDVFPRIAGALKCCRFVFINNESERVNAVFAQRLNRAFAELGLNYRDYCLFLERLNSQAFAGTTALADVFLDSIGWSGYNTVMESTAYNLPIVTWPGELLRGRHALAILKRMGVEETIASSKDDYVRLAVRLGQDRLYRQQVAQRIAERKRRLYGDLSPVRALEAFLDNVVSAIDTDKFLALNIQPLIDAAVQKHKLGELDEAESIYRQIVQLKPDQREKLASLGNHYYLIAVFNLGNILQQRGQIKAAAQCYHQALALKPDYAEAYYNLGNTFRLQSKFTEALDAYQQAISLKPDYVEAYFNSGTVFEQQRSLTEAAQFYQQALKLKPDLAQAYNNLGNILKQQGKVAKAIESYQQAVSIRPNYADAYYNLGNVFQEQGKLTEAVDAYQQALMLKPDMAKAYNNLGNLLEKQGQLEEAIQLYSQALKLKADPKICNNLASTLSRQGEREQALEYYQQALSLAPNYAPAQLGLLTSQLPIIYTSTAEIQQRRANYQHVLQQLAQHYQQATPAERAKAAEAVGTSQPFYLAYQGLLDRPLQQIYGELICQLMSSRYPQWSHPLALPTWQAPEKIRVGVVCGLFFKHSVWKIPLKGWVQNLDRERFDLLGYYTGSRQDEETAVAAQAFGQFRQGPLPVEQWCELIAQDRLHVLLFPEFGMDPMSAKLGGLRLAPIQATCGGHPQTCGLPTIDYHLSSDLMEPANAQDHYSETLVRLPNLAICYTFLDVQPQAVSRADLGIAADEVMFWCCQSLYKYLPQHDDVFPRIAGALKCCRFVFINNESERVNAVFAQRLNRAFAELGLNYRDYCLFLERLNSQAFAGTTALADVFLDSIGWSGYNTVMESTAYNLPIVTWPGELLRGRHALAILKRMGVEETIASSKDDYVRLAVRLGQDRLYRQQVAQRIAERKRRLYGDLSPVRALEAFLDNVVSHKFRA